MIQPGYIGPIVENLESKKEATAGILAPDIYEFEQIPHNSYVFDYHSYVATYERSKTKERGQLLEEIGRQADELECSSGKPEYIDRRLSFDAFVGPVNSRWGAEFDQDIIRLITTILILHKDITFVMQSNAELYWYDRLVDQIKGTNPNEDEWFEDPNYAWQQKHPGRPDKAKIKLRILRLSDEATETNSETQKLELAA